MAGWLVWLLSACGSEAATPVVTPVQTVQLELPTAMPVPPTPTVLQVPTATARPDPVPTAGPAVAGVLSAPPESRRLDFSLATLQRIQQKLAGRFARVDLTTLAVAGYAGQQLPVDIFTFYRVNLQARGWQETHDYDNRFGIYFTKADQVAAINATAIPDDLTVNFLAGFVPSVKGQIKGGETLILLGQGPAATFEVLKK